MPLNMSKLTTIPIALTHGQAEALAAVASGGGGNAATLAAWIIGEWVGRLPVEQTPPPTMAKAHQRLATLQAFWKARKTASAATAYEIIAARCLAKGRKISRTALYEWEARWRESGLTGLIDRHKPASKPLQSPFINRVKELHRAGRGRRITTCYHQAKHEFRGRGKTIPSYRTTARSMGRKRQIA